ncbi:hypothetical protein pdam_00005436 [Pocillopora damicornis]|uniref:Complex III assembly factor LYRM7 n=1 Tax=Pocillopora damicornis TaxID=46731 RepID=A0A3M6U3N4_POCDA|nr:hypothetical protein pdam_00005436 [Pocillopora damicornis]
MRFSFEIEFEIVEDSTKRGRNKLVDRRGYTYNVKRRQGRNTDWQCTVRPKLRGRQANLSWLPRRTITRGRWAQAQQPGLLKGQKKEAVANLFKPLSAVVNEVLMEEQTDDPCPSMPKPVNLAKAANHLRQRLRLADSVGFEFEFQPEHIPENFLRGDIKVQEPGLQSSYHHDRGTYQLLRKFMALPFLPAGAILEAFFKLKRKANTDQLKASANYVEQNWIVINTWPLSYWSVYLRAIRTNKDVEGWHNGLNRRAQVLSRYRSLHRTRLKVFRDDSFALEVGKQNIRTEFLKHKIDTDQAKIAELIQMVEGAEKVPRCNIVQGIQTDNGTFRLRITKDTELQNNVFDESNLA